MTRKNQTVRLAVCALLASAAPITTAIATDSPAASKKVISIPAGDLNTALESLVRQTGIQLLYDLKTVEGVRTPGVRNATTPGDALNELLEGTRLRTQTDRSGALLISDARPSAASGATRELPEPTQVAELEEIIVTGTSIVGVAPASPVIRMSREQIEKAGMATVGEAIRAMPQNFNGGQNPGVFGALGAADGNANLSGASTPNLRGLGAGATLTLVDGQRLAPNGFFGGSDLSTIPLSAVERVEVLTDGASAIYGSDAIAGVVNVILRKDFEGAEGRVRFGTSSAGGARELQYAGTVGGAWSSGSALMSYEYKDTDALFSRDRSFAQQIPDPTSILPQLRGNSVFARVAQQIGARGSIFVNGVYADRTQHQAQSDTGFTALYDVESRQYSATVGAESNFGRSWTAKVTATSARDLAPQTTVLIVPDTPVSTSTTEFENESQIAEVFASGPVATLPAGDLLVAVGGGYRDESYVYDTPAAPTLNHSGDRNIRYAFSEIHVPLVPRSAARAGLRSLALTAAGRYEKYSDFGSTTNPKIGLVYVPADDFTVRASWGTSFHAPSFEQTVGIRQVVVERLPAPTPSGQTQLLLTGGGNANLDPESARSWSLTVEYAPSAWPDLSVNATVYDLRYEDRIVSPFATSATALANPALYAPFIIANPSAQLQSDVIAAASPGRFRNRSGLPYSAASVAYIVQAQYQNVSERSARGVDLSANYRWDVGGLGIDGFFAGSYLDEEQRFLAASPEVAVAGTIFNPPSRRMRAGVIFQMRSFSLLTALNYIGEADNEVSAIQDSVSSWTTVDAALTYAPNGSGLLRGLEARLSAQNLLDRDPPFVAADSTGATGVQYDSTNASPLGRFLSVELTRKF